MQKIDQFTGVQSPKSGLKYTTAAFQNPRLKFTKLSSNGFVIGKMPFEESVMPLDSHP